MLLPSWGHQWAMTGKESLGRWEGRRGWVLGGSSPGPTPCRPPGHPARASSAWGGSGKMRLLLAAERRMATALRGAGQGAQPTDGLHLARCNGKLPPWGTAVSQLRPGLWGGDSGLGSPQRKFQKGSWPQILSRTAGLAQPPFSTPAPQEAQACTQKEPGPVPFVPPPPSANLAEPSCTCWHTPGLTAAEGTRDGAGR